MKTSRLRVSKAILIALMLLVLSAMVFTGCQNKQKVESIEIDASTNYGVYKVGTFASSDFSKIMLNVTYENQEVNAIALQKSMLTTEDKAKLSVEGEQTLTINYKGKTTTFTVTLVGESAEVVEVTFKDGTGQNATLGAKRALAGSKVDELTAPLVEGKVFKCWVDANGSVVDLTKVSASITVYPSYTNENATYSYQFLDYKGKVLGTPGTLDKGEKLTKAPTVDMSNYPEIASYVWSEELPYTMNSDVTIRMVPEYKQGYVRFVYAMDSDPNRIYELPETYNLSVKYGVSVTTKRQAVETKLVQDGYDIVTAPTLSDTINLTDNGQQITFKYIVRDANVTLNVYDDADAKTLLRTISKKAGEKYVLPTEAATVRGSYLSGWKIVGDDGSFEIVELSQTAEWSVNNRYGRNVKLVPVYSEITVPVTFNFVFRDEVLDRDQDLYYTLTVKVSGTFSIGEIMAYTYVDNLLQNIVNNKENYEKAAGKTASVSQQEITDNSSVSREDVFKVIDAYNIASVYTGENARDLLGPGGTKTIMTAEDKVLVNLTKMTKGMTFEEMTGSHAYYEFATTQSNTETIYCDDCNVFMKGNVSNLVATEASALLNGVGASMDEVAKAYADFMAKYTAFNATTLKEETAKSGSAEYTLYTTYLNKVKVLSDKLGNNLVNAAPSMLVGVSNKFDIRFDDKTGYRKVASPVKANLGNYYEKGNAGYAKTADKDVNENKTYYVKFTYDEVVKAIATLFGYNNANAFTTFAKSIAATYYDNAAGAAKDARLKYDGAVYTEYTVTKDNKTENKSTFILPYALYAEALDGIVVIIVIVDANGDMALWVSDVELAFDFANFDNVLGLKAGEVSQLYLLGRCDLFEQEKVIGYVVTGLDDTYDGTNVYIPSEYKPEGAKKALPVLYINDNALQGKNIMSVPSSLVEIGNAAFKNANIYCDLNLPNVVYVNENAFLGAKFHGESIAFSDLMFLGANAFQNVNCGNDNLSIDLGQRLAIVPDAAFQYSNGIVSITTTDRTRRIGNRAFLDSGVEEINGLTGVEYVGVYAFEGVAVGEISLPYVREIGASAFANNENLTTLSLGSASYEEAFTFTAGMIAGCVALRSIYFGAGFTASSVDKEIMAEMDELAEITVSEENKNFFSDNGVLYAIVSKTEVMLVYYPNDKTGSYKVVTKKYTNNEKKEVDMDVSIDATAFTNSTIAVLDLTDVPLKTISGTVDTVYAVKAAKEADKAKVTAAFTNANVVVGAEAALYGYDESHRLVYQIVKVENKVDTIAIVGGYKRLTEITVPATIAGKKVTIINDGAFANYANLESLRVEATVDGWNNTILSGDAALEELYIAGFGDDYKPSLADFAGNGYYATHNVIYLGGKPIGYNNAAVVNGRTITTVSAAEAAEYFAEGIPEKFFQNTNLTEIDLPESVKYIGDGAFAGSSLKSFSAVGITSLGKEAFKGCTGLTEIVIRFTGNAANMGASVFKDCSNLEKATFEGNVQADMVNGKVLYSLPVETFYNCAALKELDLGYFNNFKKANGVSYAFANCTSLTSFDFSNWSGEDIPTGTFVNAGLKYAILSNQNITSIGEQAFYGSSVSYVLLGVNITAFGDAAFGNCIGLIAEIPYSEGGVYAKDAEISNTAFPRDTKFYVSAVLDPDTAFFVGRNVENRYPTIKFSITDDTDETVTSHVGNMVEIVHKIFLTEEDVTAPAISGFIFAEWQYKIANQTANSRVEFPFLVKDNYIDNNNTVTFYAKYYNENVGSLDVDMDVKYVYYIEELPYVALDDNESVSWKLVINGVEQYSNITELPYIIDSDSGTKYSLKATITGGTRGTFVETFDGTGMNGYAITQYSSADVASMTLPDVFDDGKKGPAPVIVLFAGAFREHVPEEFSVPTYVRAILKGYGAKTLGFDNAGFDRTETFGDALKSITIPAATTYIEDGVFAKVNIEEIVFAENSRLKYVSTAAFEGSKWWVDQYAKAQDNYGFIMAGRVALQFVGTAEMLTLDKEGTEGDVYQGDYVTSKKFGLIEGVTEEAFEVTFTLYFEENGYVFPLSCNMNVQATIDEQLPDGIYIYSFNRANVKSYNNSNSYYNSVLRAVMSVSEITIWLNTSDLRTYKQGTNLVHVKVPTKLNGYDVDIFGFSISTGVDDEITIPSGTYKLAEGLFRGNQDLTKVILNMELEIVGDEAFNNAKNLETIQYGAANEQFSSIISEVGKNVFNVTKWYGAEKAILGTIFLHYTNAGHSAITITENITAIAEGAFKEDASGLTSITFSSSTLRKIGAFAFKNSGLKTITLPRLVSDIGRGAFMNCIALTSADLLACEITEVPEEAFSGDKFLTALSLPESAQRFGRLALNGCVKLSQITADGIQELSVTNESYDCGLDVTEWYKASTEDEAGNDVVLRLGNVLVKYVVGKKAEALYEENKEYKVTVPEGITMIAHGAFKDAKNSITEVEIPAGVVEIGEKAFMNCQNLKVVTFGEGLTTIASRAFEGLSELTTAILPASLEKIGDYAFRNTGLRTEVTDDKGVRVSDEGYTIPDNVTSIGTQAFYGANYLTIVNLGSKIAYIGDHAFDVKGNIGSTDYVGKLTMKDVKFYKVNWALDINQVIKEDGSKELAPIEKLATTLAEKNIGANVFVTRNDYEIRFYAESSVVDYIKNEDLFTTGYRKWNTAKPDGYGWNFYKEGDLPEVKFNNEGYKSTPFESEYICEGDILTPGYISTENTYTFMYWTIQGTNQRLEYPYVVTKDITLVASFYKNEVEKQDNKIIDDNGVEFETDGEKITKITPNGTDTLYIPNKIDGKTIKSISVKNDTVKTLVLTNAKNFSGAMENIFAGFTALEKLVINGKSADFKVVPVTLTDSALGLDYEYTFYVVYSNDVAVTEAYGTKLLAVIGNVEAASEEYKKAYKEKYTKEVALLETLKARIVELEAKGAVLTTAERNQLSELREKVETDEALIAVLTAKLTPPITPAEIAELATARISVAELETRIADLERRRTAAEDAELTEAYETKATLNARIDELGAMETRTDEEEQELSEKREERDRLQARIVELEEKERATLVLTAAQAQELKQKQTENAMLEARIAELEAKDSRTDDEEQELSAKREELAALEPLITALGGLTYAEEQELADKEAQFARLGDRYDELDAKLDAYEVQELNEALERVERIAELSAKRTATEDAELTEAYGTETALSDRIAELGATNPRTDEEEQELTEKMAELETLRDRIAVLEGKATPVLTDEEAEELAAGQEELATLKARIAELRGLTVDEIHTLNAALIRVDELEAEIAALEAIEPRTEAEEQELTDKRAELDTVNETIDTLNAKATPVLTDEEEEEMDDIFEQGFSLVFRIWELQERRTGADTQELVEKQEAFVTVTARIAELEAMDARTDEQEQELTDKTADLAEIMERIAELGGLTATEEQELTEKKAELDRLEARIEELEAKTMPAITEAEAAELAEKQAELATAKADKAALEARITDAEADELSEARETVKQIERAMQLNFVFEVPEGVIEIAKGAFVNTQLTAISLPSTLTKIGDEAFDAELEKLRIARGISLLDVTYAAIPEGAPIMENAAGSVEQDASYVVVSGLKQVFRDPEAEGTVGEFYAIANVLTQFKTDYATFTSLTMPTSFNGIDITVLATGLNRNVEMVNGQAKEHPIYIEGAVTLPANVQQINAKAFTNINFNELTSADAYDKLRSIADNVFSGTDYYAKNNEIYVGKILVKLESADDATVIRPGTISIATSAFRGASSLTKVVIPDSVVSIGDEAFYGCNSLVEVTIPNSVERIGANAFAACPNLKTINIDTMNSTLVEIGNKAFQNDKALKTLKLPSSLKIIGDSAFSGCTSLTTITFDGYQENEEGTMEIAQTSLLEELGENAFTGDINLTEITIPKNVKVIKSSTFENCTALIYVNFVRGSLLEEIEDNAFANCSMLGSMIDLENPSLVTVKLPNSLIRVGASAFSGCARMWGIEFQHNVASLGANVFKGCTNLAKIVMNRATAPSIESTTFFGSDDAANRTYKLRIYVQADPNKKVWANYKNAWAAVFTDCSKYLFEINETPTVTYVLIDENGAEKETKTVEADIILNPSQLFSGSTGSISEWYYYKAIEYTKDDNGYVSYNVDGSTAGTTVDYVHLDEEGKKTISYKKYGRQDLGETNFILVVDYDNLYMSSKLRNKTE